VKPISKRKENMRSGGQKDVHKIGRDMQICTRKKNKARIEQVTTTRELKHISSCKESIEMVNSAYITTKQEVDTSSLNVRQRKPIPTEETQTLLHRRNEEFLKMLVFDINWKI
jgi:hypothetical protein